MAVAAASFDATEASADGAGRTARLLLLLLAQAAWRAPAWVGPQNLQLQASRGP